MTFARSLTPPYYAVVFTNRLADDAGYAETAAAMGERALKHPGCLGHESARDDRGFGITVSYWRDEAAILSWKADVEHRAAMAEGIDRFYEHYELRVAKVERAYSGPHGRSIENRGAEAWDMR
ncbi:MAG: antibiotic biosynthesis monooxygenase [Pseudomonadota bacterium]